MAVFLSVFFYLLAFPDAPCGPKIQTKMDIKYYEKW
jgi:hypothetical protein